ncbi:LPXTG cell wall anchor domain-containing protein [Capnocytophaga granulosa]
MKGHEAVAMVLGGATIVGLTGIFVYGKRKQNEEINQ